MQPQDASMAPPAFPKLPKSALFSKLQSFLPVMEQENKKLEEAVAAGDGAKHSIEVDDEEAQVTPAESEGGAEKPQVIEMNFALGMMENDKSDSGDDSSDDDEQIDLKASIMAATGGAQLPQRSDKEEAATFDLKLSRASTKSRPMIQELN